jgi:hypothetical protein
MRREEDGPADFISRPQPGDDVGATGQNFLKFNLQSGAGGDGSQKIRHALFAGVRMAQRQKGRIHAGQRDKFRQKFFRARHVGRVAKLNG